MQSYQHIEVSWGSLWKIIFVGIAATVFFLSLDIWVGVFLAIVISFGLNPFVNLLERWRIPRLIGTILAFLVILFVFASTLYLVIPRVIVQAQILLEGYFDVLAPYFDINALDRSSISDIVLSQLKLFTAGGAASAGVFEFSKNFFGTVALAISALAIAFYLTVDNRGIEKFIKAILPAPHEDKVNEIIHKARRKIGYWVQAQIGLSFFVGTLTFIGLSVIGLWFDAPPLYSNALILGLLAAVFEIIPFVGPFFSGLMAVIIAFSAEVPNSGALALYVAIMFIIIQQLESDVLVPTLMNRAVGLHPVAVLVALLIGAKFFGFIGILLAVPASVVIQEFIEDWSSKKTKHNRLV